MKFVINLNLLRIFGFSIALISSQCASMSSKAFIPVIDGTLDLSCKTTNENLHELLNIPEKETVKKLILSAGSITKLDKGTFDGFTSLEVLDLSKNLLTSLDESVFEGLTVRYLDLSNNKLEKISEGTFKPLKHCLEILNLSNNLLMGWSQGDWENGSELWERYNEGLDDQNYLMLNVFDDTFNLKSLRISGNYLGRNFARDLQKKLSGTQIIL